MLDGSQPCAKHLRGLTSHLRGMTGTTALHWSLGPKLCHTGSCSNCWGRHGAGTHHLLGMFQPALLVLLSMIHGRYLGQDRLLAAYRAKVLPMSGLLGVTTTTSSSLDSAYCSLALRSCLLLAACACTHHRSGRNGSMGHLDQTSWNRSRPSGGQVLVWTAHCIRRIVHCQRLRAQVSRVPMPHPCGSVHGSPAHRLLLPVVKREDKRWYPYLCIDGHSTCMNMHIQSHGIMAVSCCTIL